MYIDPKDIIKSMLEAEEYSFAINQHNRPVLIHTTPSGNKKAYQIGGDGWNSGVQNACASLTGIIRPAGQREIDSYFEAYASSTKNQVYTWTRTAQSGNSLIIESGDAEGYVIRLKNGEVDIKALDPEIIFLCTDISLPYAEITEQGDISLFDKYFNNIHPVQRFLLLQLVCYFICHPIKPDSNFPILVLNGPEGSAKTTAAKILKLIIDPNKVLTQSFPKNDEAMYMAMSGNLLTIFDNARVIPLAMSDTMCGSTGGITLKKRKLYTDISEIIMLIHGPIIITTVHDILTQPDLISRTIQIQTLPIQSSDRKTESSILKELTADMPSLLRGILDRTAKILEALPNAKASHPERMADFSLFLAAAEQADDVGEGYYQSIFSDAMKQLMDANAKENEIICAIRTLLTQHQGEYSDTPTNLLKKLNQIVDRDIRSKNWPRDPASLSRKMNSLKGQFLSQSIKFERSKGSNRIITISKINSEAM